MITPYYREAVRGNAVTVHRLEKYLRRQGCEPEVFSLDAFSVAEAVDKVIAGRYDICHAFHAHAGGGVASRVRAHAGIPYLVTLTGSDIYEALLDDRRTESLSNLCSASAVVAFHTVVAARLALQASVLSDRIIVIPQGVDLPDMNTGYAEYATPDSFIFLLPAGVRPVKNLVSTLQPLAELHRKHPELRLQMAGPVMDHEYASKLFTLLPEYPFARYLGVVAHQDMVSLYRNAAVVLNSSRFEGGMANSLLEAMALAKPVLASDIEGNRSLVTDGVNGLLYRDSSDFYNKAGQLFVDPVLRQRLGKAGRRMVEENHSPEQEAARYLELYRKIISAGRGQPMTDRNSRT